MAGIAIYVNAPIDMDSARMCKAEAIAHAQGHTTKAEDLREYITLCDDVTAGRALFSDAFPHGAESTLMWLLHGGLTGVKHNAISKSSV
jgi:hypothetical protein